MTEEPIENTGEVVPNESVAEEPVILEGQLELTAQITRDFMNCSALLDYCKMLGLQGGAFNKAYNERGTQVYRLVYNRTDV